MVERFNRTLKSILRKHAAWFGPQWDYYLSGVLWAYCNMPHEAMGEKSLLMVFDCRSPTEAALLPLLLFEAGSISEYRDEVILALSSARELAVESITRVQKKYKALYDRTVVPVSYHVGDWVLVNFPQEENGRCQAFQTLAWALLCGHTL